MATERYLVTGGCGLQGSHIVEKLLARYPIAPVVAVMARKPTTNLFSGVSYRAGDISSASDIARVFDAVRPTVVFHCAAAMTIGRGATAAGVPTDDDVRRINVGGTRLLLDASRERGVKAFVFTSSAGVVQRFGFKDIVNADESLETVRESDGAAIYPKTKVRRGHAYICIYMPIYMSIYVSLSR